MSALSLASPFPIFTDIDGNPLEDGYVYIGTAGLNPEVNPISVYWDAALTIPAAQPIRTLGGYPSRSGSPAVIYANADDCAVLVKNKNGSLIFSALNQTRAIPAGVITFVQTGTGAVERTAEAKLQESVSVLDFGADPTGATDSTTAINAALAASKNVYFPAGVFIHSDTLSAQIDSHIHGAGKIITKIKYTGAGDAWNLAGGYTTFEDLFIVGTPTAPRYFNVGTRAIYSPTVGATVVGINCRFEAFATLLEGTGYYWKFYNCAFYSSQYAFNNMSANNLSFFGCAFNVAQNFVQVAPGAGPVSFFGCSIEAWSGVAIANVSGSSIALEMAGCYIENYPGTNNTGTGLGQFVNAFLIAGDFQSVSFHGNSVQCVGVRRILYNTNTTNAVMESTGNVFYYESGAALSSTESIYDMAGGVSIRGNDSVSIVANAGYGTYTTTVSIAVATKNISGVNPLTGKALAATWVQITPNANWANSGTAGFPTLACKVENGLLHIQGQVTCSNVAGTTIGTLPAAILEKLNCSSSYLEGLLSRTNDTAPTRYRVVVSSGNLLVDNPTVASFDIVPTPWPINS